MPEEKEQIETEDIDREEDAVAGTVSSGEIDEVEQLRDEVAQANDRALRAAAELENVRRRSRQQLNDQRRYAVVPLIQGLLPVLDNISRALEAADGSAGDESLLEGFKIVASQMRSVLAQSTLDLMSDGMGLLCTHRGIDSDVQIGDSRGLVAVGSQPVGREHPGHR